MTQPIHDETTPISSPLSIGGVAVTDVSAVIGAVFWLVAVLTGGLDGIVAFGLSLAPLVLIPLGMRMAATPPFAGTARLLYDAAVVAQPVGAVLVLVSLVMPLGSTGARLAAIPWLFVTGLLGLTALARTLDRGIWPFSETVIDGGFAYSIVGAVALVLHQFGITFWFEPVIILLTAVHFHYAGFVLPVLTGIAGRALDEQMGTMFRFLTGIVLIGPAIIAVGISFSPVVEVFAVSVFTVAVAVLGGYVVVRVAPARPRLQGVFIAVSAVVLPASMVLALAYGLSTYTGINPLGLGISTMIELHGVLNAVGFALIGVVGWRIAVPSRHTGSL
jgi:hypothetical protein